MSTDDEPPADISGPTVPRMILGNQLHRFREAAGISPDRAGYEIRASRSKISRMENGKVGFKVRDVADLLDLYGIADEETAGALSERLARLGADLLATTLPRIAAGQVSLTAQDDGAAVGFDAIVSESVEPLLDLGQQGAGRLGRYRRGGPARRRGHTRAASGVRRRARAGPHGGVPRSAARLL